MMRDKIIISYLHDAGIAADFYRALCNVDWYQKREMPDDERIMSKLRGDKFEPWGCSWRQAGGYIADIRNTHYNTNENYMDFYCAGHEGTVTPLVLECFDRMGWRPILY